MIDTNQKDKSDLISVLNDFERLTGRPPTALDAEIEPYGVTVQQLLAGARQPSQFLASELAGILKTDYGLSVQVGDDRASYDYHYSRMEASSSFRRYCREAHGNDLVQINELDNATMEKMLDWLDLKPEQAALDVGCGSGYLTEYFSDLTGARFIGVDFSAVAIELACERTLAKRQSLDFRLGDLNHLEAALPDLPQLQALIAMEVLYAASDLNATLQTFVTLLRRRGKMVFIANQHIQEKVGEAHRLQPDGTDISLALGRMDLGVQVFDLTENKIAYLDRSIAVLERM